LTDPQHRLRAYMLMRGALDDRLVVGFLGGRYYGVVDSEITPVFGLMSATFAKYRARPDGGYDCASYEIPFFTDLDTGRVLDRLHIPYTGEEVSVSQTPIPPGALIIGSDLEIRVAKAPPGMVARDRVLAPLEADGDIWMTEQATSAYRRPGATRVYRYSEVVTLHARRADLEAEGALRVPCQTAYASISAWRPWMKMDDHPGHILGTGAGGYGAGLEQLPKAMREALAERRPDVLSDPERPLAGLLAG
jgi:hypothetical protein